MDIISALKSIREEPDKYLTEVSSAAFINFISGFDMAHSSSYLDNFIKYLAEKHKQPHDINIPEIEPDLNNLLNEFESFIIYIRSK